ncbi:uncharacterized protein LOC119399358 [Rhipicephalus sanguineus]|uniref:uncharacterized protein LOC119399358 n=1 Tax=Rhipicephalus sanguineus TaxID=34632 RepID=UPI001893C5CE|nr:uncharacterized protein LOC119399358 [Rhipicephalus sanguineus]
MAFATFALALLMSAAMVTGSSDCIAASVPGILDLGTCLGDSLELCNATSDEVMATVMQLVQCLVTTLTQINAVGAVAALIDIVGIVLGVLGANLSGLTNLLMPLCAEVNVPGCITLLSPDDTCTAPINVSLPDNLNLGECLNDTLLLCKDGEPVTDTVLLKLVEAVVCVLNNLLETSSEGVLNGLACAVVELLSGAAANANFLLKITLGGLATTISSSIQCS